MFMVGLVETQCFASLYHSNHVLMRRKALRLYNRNQQFGNFVIKFHQIYANFGNFVIKIIDFDPFLALAKNLTMVSRPNERADENKKNNNKQATKK